MNIPPSTINTTAAPPASPPKATPAGPSADSLPNPVSSKESHQSPTAGKGSFLKKIGGSMSKTNELTENRRSPSPPNTTNQKQSPVVSGNQLRRLASLKSEQSHVQQKSPELESASSTASSSVKASSSISEYKGRKAITEQTEKFEKSLRSLDIANFHKDPKAIDESDQNVPKRTFQQKWDERMSNSRNILSWTKNLDFEDSNYHAYVASKSENPTGLLVMDKMGVSRTHAYIESMVTMPQKPGTSGTGKELIQYAESKSREWGKNGKLELTATFDSSEGAFKKLGFQFEEGSTSKMERKPPPPKS